MLTITRPAFLAIVNKAIKTPSTKPAPRSAWTANYPDPADWTESNTHPSRFASISRSHCG